MSPLDWYAIPKFLPAGDHVSEQFLDCLPEPPSSRPTAASSASVTDGLLR